MIKTTGTFTITPITAYNDVGNPYRIREVTVIEVNEENKMINTLEFGWVSWTHFDEPEKKKRAKIKIEDSDNFEFEF